MSEAIDRVHRLVRDRPVLRPGFAEAWPTLAATDPALLEAWAGVTLDLCAVNAGPTCIAAFWLVASRAAAPHLTLAVAGGVAAADICRLAGVAATLACLEAWPTALRLTAADPAELAAWWRGLHRLARDAPALVPGVARRVEALLAGGGVAFEGFVAAGLKATVRDKQRRAAFFALDDDLARSLLHGAGAGDGFAACARMLAAFATALWRGPAPLRPGDGRRTAITAGIVLLPRAFAGAPPGQTRALYRAAVAHAYAHLTVPGAAPQPIGALQPVQRALVGLVEDARVEALALRRFPGLRQLWAPFHGAAPAGARTAEALMARLARALLDPAYADGDGFVAKGRALFAASADRLDDPALSRRIGGLLGNDLGQMRLSLNARTYTVEPAYRDDNIHLWDLPDTPDDAPALPARAARAADGRGQDQPGDGAPAARARDAGVDACGDLLATYPEWDRVAGVERPDWTSLRDTQPRLRTPAAAPGEAALQAPVARLVRKVVLGAPMRQPRREDGETLDLDAAIAAAIARRRGRAPDSRVYRDRRPQGRDLATLIILDASQSTAAIGAGGQSVLAAQRVAVGALAAALAARGDPFALRAFASAGRQDVRLTRLKDFDEPLGPVVDARLAGLAPGLSTRLGAALRHAGAELAPRPARRKLLLVLTDGEPSDIDVADPQELVEDARRAVAGLRRRGIDVFAIVMDPAHAGSGAAIFGRHATMPVRRLAELPARLAGVYFRLAQR